MQQRIIALDVLRGYTIAAMILVSTPATWDFVYLPLTHAGWNNTTPTDLIFPFFLFMVGVSVAISLGRLKDEGKVSSGFYLKIASRFFKIMGLGVFLNLYPYFDFANYGWSGVGYTGVLPRIAIVYLACTLLYLYYRRAVLWITCLCILVAYWLVMYFIPIPGTGTGVIDPGINVAHYADRFILNLSANQWVPEGVLSTFPAIATGITGLICGDILRSEVDDKSEMVRLFFVGFALLLAGVVWSWFFPLNKNIWSSSFALYTAGFAMLSLAAVMYAVERWGCKVAVRFGVVFGSNAIAIYVLFHLLHPLFLSWGVFRGMSTNVIFFKALTSAGIAPKLASLLYAVVFTALCYMVAYLLYRKKILIKL